MLPDEVLFDELLLDEVLFDEVLFDEVLFDELLFDELFPLDEELVLLKEAVVPLDDALPLLLLEELLVVPDLLLEFVVPAPLPVVVLTVLLPSLAPVPLLLDGPPLEAEPGAVAAPHPPTTRAAAVIHGRRCTHPPFTSSMTDISQRCDVFEGRSRPACN
jgi:hypothetical protein